MIYAKEWFFQNYITKKEDKMKGKFGKIPMVGILVLFILLSLLATSCYTTAQVVEETPKEKIPEETPSVKGDALIIYLSGEISAKTDEEIGGAILGLIDAKDSSEDSAYSRIKVLEIRIDSPGGRLDTSLKICSLIDRVKKSVTVRTVACGNALSGAALILSAGTKGERYVGSNSLVMIHDASFLASFYINRKSLDKTREYYENNAQFNLWHEALAKNTGQTLKKIKEDCYGEKWFDSEEAIVYGLADRIW